MFVTTFIRCYNLLVATRTYVAVFVATFSFLLQLFSNNTNIYCHVCQHFFCCYTAYHFFPLLQLLCCNIDMLLPPFPIVATFFLPFPIVAIFNYNKDICYYICHHFFLHYNFLVVTRTYVAMFVTTFLFCCNFSIVIWTYIAIFGNIKGLPL